MEYRKQRWYRGATADEILTERLRIEKAGEGTAICPYCGTTHESSLCSFTGKIAVKAVTNDI